ncbi:MAG: MFS transporter [Burkholderiaceae bacterium]|nr:MFS transporter [Burkholderiaceae bacterium]
MADASIRATLQHVAFRTLLGGGTLYFIGNFMQSTAAAWMMVELTGSSFLAALVQTAVFLPMFLLALPAGVLGDIADRRRLMLGAMAAQAVAVALLAVLGLLGKAGPASVLCLIFVAGCCTALMSPSWNTGLAESVPREDLPQAITLVGIAYNAARALGPAFAGAVYALGGAGPNFAAAFVGVGLMAWSVHRFPPAPHPPSRLPAERLWGGMLSGLRFAWHSPAVFAQLVRTVAYAAAGSALWALLPAIAAQRLGMGAAGFGFLMGCMGTGAVAAGFLIGRWRVRYGLERLVAGGCIGFALAMLVAALLAWRWGVYAALFVAGSAWMAVMSTFNTATQTSAPGWVRSRALAMHTLCALGSFAMGSALWGAASDIVGLQPALCAAAALMLGGPLLARRYPLRMGEAHDVTQAVPWEDLFVAHEPNPEAGPVAVEIRYRVRPEDTDAFLDTIAELRAPRRRDGAAFWRVYRDLSDPTRFVERFIVESWADYLHQRARQTLADQAVETRVRAFVPDGEPIVTGHYIAER